MLRPKEERIHAVSFRNLLQGARELKVTRLLRMRVQLLIFPTSANWSRTYTILEKFAFIVLLSVSFTVHATVSCQNVTFSLFKITSISVKRNPFVLVRAICSCVLRNLDNLTSESPMAQIFHFQSAFCSIFLLSSGRKFRTLRRDRNSIMILLLDVTTLRDPST